MKFVFKLLFLKTSYPLWKLTKISLLLLFTPTILSCASNQEKNAVKQVQDVFVVPENWKETKIPDMEVAISYPADWELGESKYFTANVHWFAIPPFEVGGNIVLSIIPWNYSVDFSGIKDIDYKNELLMSNTYYSDLNFEIFDPNFIIDGNPAIFTYLIAQGKFVDKQYQETIFQVLNNNKLYTLKYQSSTPPKLTAQEIDLLKTVAKSIKFRD